MTEPAGVDAGSPAWSAYGLGLQVVRLPAPGGDRTLVGHGGSMPGFLAGVFVDRATGDGALVLRNATSGADGGLLPDLLNLLDAHEPALGAAWRAEGVLSAGYGSDAISSRVAQLNRVHLMIGASLLAFGGGVRCCVSFSPGTHDPSRKRHQGIQESDRSASQYLR